MSIEKGPSATCCTVLGRAAPRSNMQSRQAGASRRTTAGFASDARGGPGRWRSRPALGRLRLSPIAYGVEVRAPTQAVVNELIANYLADGGQITACPPAAAYRTSAELGRNQVI